MGKAAVAVMGVFAAGSTAMSLLGSWLGVWAEAATLLLVGAALYGSGLALGSNGKVTAPEGIARQA